MASTMGTSGWTHVDAAGCLATQSILKKKSSLFLISVGVILKLTSPRCAGDAGDAGLRNGGPGDGDTTGCDGVPDKRPHLSTHAEEENRIPFASTTFGAVAKAKTSWTTSVSHVAAITLVLYNGKKDWSASMAMDTGC